MKPLYTHYTSRSGLRFARVAWIYVFFIALGGIFITKPVAAVLNIHEITTPKGIKAWFVEDQSLPVVSFSFAFLGGSANVPSGQEGLAHFAAQLLLEGAGDLAAHDFK